MDLLAEQAKMGGRESFFLKQWGLHGMSLFQNQSQERHRNSVAEPTSQEREGEWLLKGLPITRPPEVLCHHYTWEGISTGL